MDPANPRLLFVVSGAYGDLALAISFIHGLRFSDQSAMVLPKRLHEQNRDGLPVRAYAYGSVEDILRAAVDWDAQIIFLLSAYGFSIEGLCPPQGVKYFVDFLQGQGRLVVTTDPFLGSASTVTKSEILSMLPPPRDWLHDLLVVRPNARRIARDLNRMSDALRDMIHLYPAPVDSLDNPAGVRRISVFDPEIASRGEAPSEGQASKNTWLFVLAPNDVAIQQKKAGADGFARDLLRLFDQTTEAGRCPVLIGPSPLVESLRDMLPASLEAELVQFCSHYEFSSRLRKAEYVFFWNTFSCSAVLGRLAQKLPAFFFDEGHVAQLSRKIYEDGLRCYFGGWKPTRLKYGALDTDVLADLAVEQGRAVEGLLAYWGQSSTPQQVIEQLVHSDTTVAQ